MAIEHALVQVVRKPWGVDDLSPWSPVDGSSDAVGELLFQRAGKNAPTPGLLLKLLFTSEPLSIQVHPDDAFARSIGLPNGKTEAWYILSATPDARRHNMSEVERTSAGLRIVMPGCERRTLPKSTTRVDESAQGLLRFYKPPTCGKNLKVARRRLCGPPRAESITEKRSIFHRWLPEATRMLRD